jgi:tRNA(fMet)-specific endonuclease VapC
MYLLDTDTLTFLYEGHPRLLQRLRGLSDDEVRITLISKIEMLRGRFDFVLKAATSLDLLRAQDLLARTEQYLAPFPVVPLDEASVLHWDRLRKTKGLKKLGRADLLIASIALAQKAILVTRNLRHFRPILNLHVVNWVD